MSHNNNNTKPKAGVLERMIQDEQSKSYYVFHDIVAILIVISVVTIVLESVPALHAIYGNLFLVIDIIITGIFLVEYILRIVFTKKRLKYIVSPFGIIDLISFLPSLLIFISPLFVAIHELRVLRVIRVMRLLRLFRILKILTYAKRRYPKKSIMHGLTSVDIQIYLFTFLSVVVIAGTLMQLAEAGVIGSQITNIPQGMWWAVVTLTTVGYGDIIPITVLGKIIASFTMIIGLVLLALLITVMGKATQIALFGSPIEEEEKLLSPKKHTKTH